MPKQKLRIAPGGARYHRWSACANWNWRGNMPMDPSHLSDDFRDGFVDSLRLDTPDRTRMAAARADRSSGTFTVFHSGVYTACEPCKDDPRKPPLWQIKGRRMIHDTDEKMTAFHAAAIAQLLHSE